MGEFNSNDAARAQTLYPCICRERLVLVGVMLFGQPATASEAQVRNGRGVNLERPSPQLTGEFNSNDAARAHALD